MKDSLHVLGRLGFLVALFITFDVAAAAQFRPPPPVPVPRSTTADKSRPDEGDQGPTTLEEELRAKRAIKYAEKEHQEYLSRAREISELGQGLVSAYKEKQVLGSSDLKKLEKLEKLTKKIRNEVGASDDGFVLEHKPGTLAEAVESVGKVSTSLNEKVLKTPRRVVSAALIEEANVLLELVRVLRDFTR